jgi:pyruvate/2-oxoglutarate/acetoin dehydrogenase E1 component
LGRPTLCASIRKTGRLVVVDDDYFSYGLTGEIIATVTDGCWAALKGPPHRVAYPDITVPFSPSMERFALPNAAKVLEAVRRAMRRRSWIAGILRIRALTDSVVHKGETLAVIEPAP